jgi:hypothetical protein
MTFPSEGARATVIITPGEWLWFARSLNHEGAPMEGNAWTMLQRFAFMYPRFKKFGDFVRAFSQPVNPKFYPDGSKHLEWMAAATTDERRADLTRRAERRLRFAREGWSDISPRVKITLAKILAGELPSPVPGAIDFAAVADPEAHARARGLTLVRATPGQNSFFTKAGASSLSDRSITFRAISRAMVGAIIALLGLAGFAFWKMRRVHA